MADMTNARWLPLVALLLTVGCGDTPVERPPPTEAPAPAVEDAPTTPRERADPTPADPVPEPEPPPEDVEITGTVESTVTNEPVAGAHVEVLSPASYPQPPKIQGTNVDTVSAADTAPVVARHGGRVLGEATTDDEGSFSLTGPFTLEESVRVWAPGHVTAVVTAEGGDAYVELRGSNGHTLRVLDESDAPIPLAIVQRFHYDIDDLRSGEGTADSRGVVALQIAEEDTLLVTAMGYATRVIRDVADRGAAPIVLEAGYAMGGRVLDGDGKPIAGIHVRCDAPGTLQQITGANGRYGWDGLVGRAYGWSVAFWSAGYVPQYRRIRSGDTSADVVVRRETELTGSVVGADGKPVACALVTAYIGSRQATTETDPEGRFSVRRFAAGPCVVEARVVATEVYASNIPPAPAPWAAVEIGEDEMPGDVALTLVPMPTSVVRIAGAYADGSKLSPRKLTFSASLPPELSVPQRYLTGEDSVLSRWKAYALPPGTPVTVTAVSKDPRTVQSVEFETVTAAPDAEPFVVTFADRSVIDTVLFMLTTSRSGQVPVAPGPDVGWYVAEKRRDNPKSFAPEHVDDAERATATLEVPVGTSLMVRAFATGCATTIFEVSGVGPELQSIECVLAPEAILTGQLVTRNGRPVSHATMEIAVTQSNGRKVVNLVWTTDIGADGRFIARQLPAGPATVTVLARDGEIVAERAIEIRGGETFDLGDIKLGVLPQFRGVVTDAEGEPLGGAAIHAWDATGAPLANGTTRADGTFLIAAPLRNGVVRVAVGGNDVGMGGKRYEWGVGDTAAKGASHEIRLGN